MGIISISNIEEEAADDRNNLIPVETGKRSELFELTINIIQKI